MATTFRTPRFNDPRPSNETDRRQLLAEESIAPSETSSIYTARGTEGDRTPRATSPARSTQTQRHTRHSSLASQSTAQTQTQPYRGFPSEAAYLSALQQWADSKKYLEPMETGLRGFYGETTMEELAARPKAFNGEGLGLKRKWRARKQSKAEEKEKQAEERVRRATVT